jgi:hypothetical protein
MGGRCVRYGWIGGQAGGTDAGGAMLLTEGFLGWGFFGIG